MGTDTRALFIFIGSLGKIWELTQRHSLFSSGSWGRYGNWRKGTLYFHLVPTCGTALSWRAVRIIVFNFHLIIIFKQISIQPDKTQSKSTSIAWPHAPIPTSAKYLPPSRWNVRCWHRRPWIRRGPGWRYRCFRYGRGLCWPLLVWLVDPVLGMGWLFVRWTGWESEGLES